jgi:hypothetical protein
VISPKSKASIEKDKHRVTGGVEKEERTRMKTRKKKNIRKQKESSSSSSKG